MANRDGAAVAFLSVLIPVYNEAPTVRAVILDVLAQPMVREVLVVDDGSVDGTREVLESLRQADARVRVLTHAGNCGKGAAIRTGIAHASGSILLVQDADREYDPGEYPRIVAPLLEGVADVVYGSRFSGGATPASWHAFGNFVLTTLSNLCAGLRLTDMETGFKAFRREVLGRVSIEEERFGFEPEITAKLARLRDVRILEVPVSYRRRTLAEGKKIRWHDGAAALWCILKYNFRWRAAGVARTGA
jgi:glycosyltransferase involved in cell wall biosynthesis